MTSVQAHSSSTLEACWLVILLRPYSTSNSLPAWSLAVYCNLFTELDKIEKSEFSCLRVKSQKESIVDLLLHETRQTFWNNQHSRFVLINTCHTSFGQKYLISKKMRKKWTLYEYLFTWILEKYDLLKQTLQKNKFLLKGNRLCDIYFVSRWWVKI